LASLAEGVDREGKRKKRRRGPRPALCSPLLPIDVVEGGGKEQREEEKEKRGRKERKRRGRRGRGGQRSRLAASQVCARPRLFATKKKRGDTLRRLADLYPYCVHFRLDVHGRRHQKNERQGREKRRGGKKGERRRRTRRCASELFPRRRPREQKGDRARRR